jgi:hypothetical protein
MCLCSFSGVSKVRTLPPEDERSDTNISVPDMLSLWDGEFLCLNITLQALKIINIIPVFFYVNQSSRIEVVRMGNYI